MAVLDVDQPYGCVPTSTGNTAAHHEGMILTIPEQCRNIYRPVFQAWVFFCSVAKHQFWCSVVLNDYALLTPEKGNLNHQRSSLRPPQRCEYCKCQ